MSWTLAGRREGLSCQPITTWCPLSGRSSTPTSGRASHRFRGKAGDIESEWTICSLPPLSTSWRQKLGSGRSSVRPWRRTIGRPRRDSGKPSGASEGGSSTLPTLFTVQGGELLTSTEDIVGRWKKYFEDLLNPTDLPSSEEAEAGDSEVDSSITQAEVTEVVRKLLAVARRQGWMRSALSTSSLWMLWGCLG
ncbi:hypothetical protein L3Q82_018532 [Scortum barcoo]|uniref:Uncharacterized protein n=1 Tax=Scortum barcoo TaxID=214431 RepID=A0ACB8VGF6_9TELE|nr:hypothetical protein L3Q82_018532 [Scortum barcoo]